MLQLHAQQCFHRDISPENIIVQPNGAPVLLDFGAARRIIGDMTQALTVVLKPGYAPIEQYVEDGGLVQGPWTDVYGFAALLYCAVVGKPPPAAVTRAYKDALVPLADNPPPGYDRQLLHGIDVGLAVKPEERPASIAEFRELLGLASVVDTQQTVIIPKGSVFAGVPTGPRSAPGDDGRSAGGVGPRRHGCAGPFRTRRSRRAGAGNRAVAAGKESAAGGARGAPFAHRPVAGWRTRRHCGCGGRGRLDAGLVPPVAGARTGAPRGGRPQRRADTAGAGRGRVAAGATVRRCRQSARG